ncbi:DUF547 domain-containing protein [Portibacter marinus]|uniref:DUF547 domain-containing protein n=1 Tax=Portibacter marinus TaxID=2898660 RepID=UPI001F301D59|nr:DUF547 domain-containing protein [Portibacter marinus]
MKNILVLAFYFFCQSLLTAQQIDINFFEKADMFFKNYVEDGLVAYMKIKEEPNLDKLINIINVAEYEELDLVTQKAYLINAYNLLVIKEAVSAYPVASVQDVAGFFDRRKVTVAGMDITLNDFEKKEILNKFKDPRLHFVLVCGALGCPRITDFAYQPEKIEEQLERQTKIALNDPSFIWFENDKAQLSQIFNWYAEDFGNSRSSIIQYINQYRDTDFDENISANFYNYDWSLNSTSTAQKNPNVPANAARYIVSSTIPKGQIELKIFNNLYSQVVARENRSTFFTTNTSFLYGINRRFNLGFNTSYRRVLNSGIPSSPFDVINAPDSGNFRQGITSFGPQIRWAPKPEWQNFSIQSRLVFPIGTNLAGGDGEPYIDWGGPSLFNQFFNDRSIGTRFSLFTEFGLHWEDIGKLSNGRINQVSTPLTGILSYSITTKALIYTLAQFTPYYRIPFDYFIQGGIGGKYQFTRNIELELLYTGFTNRFLLQNEGGAATYNIGFRFNI